MKTTKPSWNNKKLGRMETGGTLRFDYPIQRKGGQWDELQQSLLIHSIAGDLPIPPILVLKGEVDEKEIDYVLDGKQRTTTVLNFIAGVKDKDGIYPERAYRLHKYTPDVELEGTEEPFEIQGKYFDQLDEVVQTEIMSAGFQIQRLEGASDELIEELFNRWNNGTPLSKQQKARAKMGVANAKIIDDILKHKLFVDEIAKFTPLQFKRSEDEGVVLQTLMIMTKDEEEFTSFVADNILLFAGEMRDVDITEATNALRDGLDYLVSLENNSPLFKKLHLPTIIMMAKKAHDENIYPIVFNAWLEDFSLAINLRTRSKAFIQTDYKNHMGAGSVKKINVLGRKNTMLIHFNKFVERYEIPVIEKEMENAEEKELEEVLS